MNLRKVYFASFFLALIVFCISILLLGHLMVEKRVTRSMDERLISNIYQSVELLIYLAEQLDNTLSDYASWDDTYQFTKDLNQEYVDTNLDVSYFSWLNLAALALLDDEGTLLYGSALNEEGKEDPVFLESLLPYLTVTYPLVSERQDIRGGLFQVNPGEVLLSVKRPVYDNSGEGTPSGSMVFVSRLSRELLESHYGLLGFPFTVEAGPPVPEPEERLLIRNPTREEAVAESIFKDIRGDWTLKLIVTQDRRELLSQISQLRKFYLVFLMITFLLAGAAFIYLLKVIIYRIESLSYQVRQIDSSNIGDRRIGTSGSDEISTAEPEYQ